MVAGEACHGESDSALVCVATAHPAKFPAAVEEATGVRPALPARMADLFERPERCEVLPNDLGTVQEFVSARLAATAAA